MLLLKFTQSYPDGTNPKKKNYKTSKQPYSYTSTQDVWLVSWQCNQQRILLHCEPQLIETSFQWGRMTA